VTLNMLEGHISYFICTVSRVWRSTMLPHHINSTQSDCCLVARQRVIFKTAVLV